MRCAGRILNVHPSLIPAFCGKGFYGLHVHEAALTRGVKVTGATVHYVNEIPDGGRILLQKAVEVLPDDTPQTLQRSRPNGSCCRRRRRWSPRGCRQKKKGAGHERLRTENPA